MISEEKRLDVLAVIRGPLALIIVVTHIQQLFGSHNMDVAARIAVVIFFVMSGYFIAYSCSNNVQKNSSFIWQDYTRGRLVKIIFPLVLIIILCAMIGYAFNIVGLSREVNGLEFAPAMGTQLLSILSFGLYGTLNYSMAFPFWFMTALLRCYVMMGLIWFLFYSPSKKYIKSIVIVFIIFYIFRSLRIKYSASYKLVLNMYSMGYFSFLGGVIAFHAREILFRNKFISLAISALLIIGVLIFSCNWSEYNNIDLLIWQIIIGASFSLVIPILVNITLPNNNFIKFLSDNSYYIYIVHQPINILMGLIFYSSLEAILNAKLFICLTVIPLSLIAAHALRITTERFSSVINHFHREIPPQRL